MSVYRTLSRADLETVRRAAGADVLDELQPISAGIENSNWFVTLRSSGHRGTQVAHAVLTLLESVPAGELPFFVALTDALAAAGLPVPVTYTLTDGTRFFRLQDRPAILVPRLPGTHVGAASPAQCAAAGTMLARLHRAAARLPLHREARDADWWPAAFSGVAPSLPADTREELARALAQATETFARSQTLPRGIIHGDFFRDNLLLSGDVVSGVLDFFHATADILAWDIAIALNDWAIVDGAPDGRRAAAFLAGYEGVRPLEGDEQAALPPLRRAAAARFWLSRLLAPGQPKAPDEMRAWLRAL